MSACLAKPVTRGGRHVGAVADLGAVAGAPEPLVTGLLVHRRGAPAAWVAWRDVEALDDAGARLADDAGFGAAPEGVLLARDVLDAQLLDILGRRVVRVGDIDLRRDGRTLYVEGVEVGLDSVLRRAGLRRLARHAAPRRIPWHELHLPAHPGATLTFDAAAPALERVSHADRLRLAGRMPAHLAARVWRAPHDHVPHRFPTHVLRRPRRRRRRAGA